MCAAVHPKYECLSRNNVRLDVYDNLGTIRFRTRDVNTVCRRKYDDGLDLEA